MINMHKVSKSYGNFRAINEVSFSISQGEIVGLLGHNGAGKTTTLKILTGFLQADDGDVTIGGKDVLHDTLAVQAMIGYLPENAPLYPELRVQDYLLMMANARNIPAKQQRNRIAEAVEATALRDKLLSPISQLSKGYRQRVGLAQAILHKPRLLILDEPTVGLDPTQIIEIRQLIKGLAKESTILFSSHILSEVEALCDRAIILMNGQVSADAKLAELAASSDALLVLDQSHEAQALEGIAATLRGLEQVQEVTTQVNGYASYRIQCRQDIMPELFQLAKAQNWPVRELRHERRTLETVFNALMEGKDLVTAKPSR